MEGEASKALARLIEKLEQHLGRLPTENEVWTVIFGPEEDRNKELEKQ